jgi:hypothetical protein
MEAQTGKFMEAGAGFSTGSWVFLSRTYRGASIMRLPCLSTLTPGPNVWALAQDITHTDHTNINKVFFIINSKAPCAAAAKKEIAAAIVFLVEAALIAVFFAMILSLLIVYFRFLQKRFINTLPVAYPLCKVRYENLVAATIAPTNFLFALCPLTVL